MAVAKRQRREKSWKQNKGRSEDGSGDQVKQTAFLASPIYIGQTQGEEKKVYKKRRQNWASLFAPFGSARPHALRTHCPLLAKQNWAVIWSCNTGLSIASIFCRCKAKPRKLHTPLTFMAPWLGSNLAETTSALPLRGRGQAQQKPNSANAPTVEAERDETPAQWQRQEAQRARNRGSKTKPRGSVSDSRRPLVGVVSPRSYGWKDIRLTKS